MSHLPITSIQIQRVYMKATKEKVAPKWAHECISSPHTGVKNFLLALCKIADAPYAHIRVKARSGKFYKLVDSIGPYKEIGWPRRFHLLDGREKDLYYQFADYKTSSDCISQKNKFHHDSVEYQYLNSLTHGLLIPIKINDFDIGYVTLSWNIERKDKEIIPILKNYIKKYSTYLPIVYQACRSVITDEYLANLWSDIAGFLSVTSEHDLYNKIANACIKFWGEGTTVYIGKLADQNTHIEIVKVAGHRENEAVKNLSKHNIPLGKGIFGYLLEARKPLLTYSIAKDRRFTYHSMREDGKCQGSAIATTMSDTSGNRIIALISIEHELINFFDYDDMRYITGIARIGYQTIITYQQIYEKTTRDFDALFTGVAHDVIEPLQALVADAEVLKYETTDALSQIYKTVDIEKYLSSISLRSSNFLNICISCGLASHSSDVIGTALFSVDLIARGKSNGK